MLRLAEERELKHYCLTIPPSWITVLPVKLLASIWNPPQKEDSEERVVEPTEENKERAAPPNIPVLYSKELE